MKGAKNGSANQHNCLCGMYKDILNGITTVVF